MNNGKNGSTGKTVGVIFGVAMAIAVAAGLAIRPVSAAKSATGGKEIEPVIPDQPPVGGFTPTPSSGGGGGIVQQPNERIVTVASHPVEVVQIPSDPIEREETIKKLSEQTGVKGDEDITGVKTGTRTDSSGRTSTIYYTPEGKILSTKQEVFNDYLEKTFTPEVRGVFTNPNTKQVSTLEAIRTGKPVNVTNFLTKRPESFPAAKADTAFLRRAQALQPTLTVGNPGASSSASVPNFSRLAALGVDLSKVDILRVQNPGFLGFIKTGQGPLTAEQKILVDQARLAIDPRNRTFAQQAEAERRQAANAAAAAARNARAKELAPSFDEATAKAFLRSKGYNISGKLSPQTFANIEAALARSGR